MASTWLWISFSAGLLVLLFIDLAAFGGKPREISLRKAAAWSGLWIGVSLAFALWLWLRVGSRPAVEFLSGYLIEKSLSIDNLFMFVLIFEYFQVRAADQRKVLAWGVFGALALRGAIIAAGAAFIGAFSWSFYIFGAFLIYASLNILVRKNKAKSLEGNRAVRWLGKILPTAKSDAGGRFFIRENGRWVATSILLALAAIEIADIVFAVDSIPAVFGVTRDPFIVFSSNACAVLGLRALYFVLAGWIVRLRHLATGVAIILLFIGCKMIAAHWLEMPSGVTLAVIACVLTIATAASVFGKPAIADNEAADKKPKSETEKENLYLNTSSNAELVARLDSGDSALRDAAARELYRRGRADAEQAITGWRADSEIGEFIANHATVGIAVTRERFARIRVLLGQPRLAEVPPDQDAEEFEWNLDAGVYLDILTTCAPGKDGAITRFLAKFGEGIQQVEFLTRDIDEVTRRLASRLNVTAIYPATRAGADGTLVNFFLASATQGKKVLVELVETKR